MPSALPISKARETSVPEAVLSCRIYFLLTEYDGHACLKTYCNLCKRNHPADAVHIPRKHCRHCQKTFLKSGFDSYHCTKTRCRKCGGHFPWSEIADHTCMEVKQCSHCIRTYPVSEWNGHHCLFEGVRSAAGFFRDRTSITMNATGKDVLLVLHTGSSRRWRHIG